MQHDARHESTSLSTYLRVLRRRKWIILACALLVPAAGLFVSLRQPAQYAASADVLLSRQNLGATLAGASDLTLSGDAGMMGTQAELARTPDVARTALTIAKIDDLTPDGLLAGTSVFQKGSTDILAFRVTAPNPARAQLLATSFAKAYVKYRSTLDTKSLVNARNDVTATLKQLKAAGRERSALYTSLEEKQQQLQTLQTLQTSQASVTRHADSATKVAPKPKQNALLGLMLGLVLGLGLAFAVDALDTRVRSSTEIGERLGLPLLARLPPPPKRFAKTNRLVMLAQPSGPSAEAFRMLRTNLDFATLEDVRARTILVTSAVEQEGKSTTAANLAIAEARSGRRVALVDLDLRVPYLDRFFGLLHAEGITDVALGNIELTAALRRIDLQTGVARPPKVDAATTSNVTDLGFLDVLVSGPLPPDPGEFVGSRRLGEILARLRDGYDLVIIDTPPALRVGDTMTLSTSADGILVVTKLTTIRRPILAELRRVLATSPTRKLGYVVAGARDGQGEGYGSSGYRYGYGGYGYGEPAEKHEDGRGVPATRAKPTAAVKEADRA